MVFRTQTEGTRQGASEEGVGDERATGRGPAPPGRGLDAPSAGGHVIAHDASGGWDEATPARELHVLTGRNSHHLQLKDLILQQVMGLVINFGSNWLSLT